MRSDTSYKVCFVIHSLQAGGMERVMSELAFYFSRLSKVDLHIILYGINREIFYSMPDNVTIHIPKFPFNNNFRRLSSLRTMLFLRAKIKFLEPSAILSFGEFWNSFVLLALFGLRYPVYVSDRAQPDKSLGKMSDMLRDWLYPKAKGIIAQTGRAKEYYQARSIHKNIRVIGNPIKPISPSNEIVRKNEVLMVGRLIESKNQDLLIRIFAKINKPGWKLILVGYDHLKQNNKEKLQGLIVELNIADKVSIEGKKMNVDLYYHKSKIFAFTSSSEGFPNVIGEAMTASLPVIAFDCVGPSEMITNNKNGFLIPLYDVDQFEEKLEMLMDDEVLRNEFGISAVEDIKNFSQEIIGKKYLDFILPDN